MKRISSITTALVIGITTLFCSSVPANAIDSYGVGAVPAYPNKDNPRAQSIFIYQLEPGASKKDGIRIVNNTDMKKTISVYAVDSENSSDGAFACKQQVEEKEGVGGWIKLAKNEVTLSGHSEEIVPFTITVPKGADVGETNGCIAVQDQRKNEATGNGIILSFRSALRVAVMVPGEIKADLTVKEFTVSRRDEKVVASPLLHNSGNVSIDSELSIVMKDMFGREIQTSGGRFPILRDTTSRFNMELDRPFWGGWYTVSGSAAFRPLQTTGEQAPLSTPETFPPHTLFIMPTATALMIEIAAAAIVLGAVGFAVWSVAHKRYMNRRSFKYEVREGDDIQALAEQNNTQWKTIARLNGLKPPYQLVSGTTLKIPGNRRSKKSKSAKVPKE